MDEKLRERVLKALYNHFGDSTQAKKVFDAIDPVIKTWLRELREKVGGIS